jgi:hypothetical protein
MARLMGLEGITLEPLYDEIILPTAVTPGEDTYQFFTIGRGSHDPNSAVASSTKSLSQTNLTGGGQRLPAPEEFEVYGLALVPQFGTSVADVQTIYNNSWLSFRGTGNSKPFQCPTRLVTAGTGLNRTDAASSVVGVPTPGAIINFPDEHVIEIFRGEQFFASINFGAAQTLTAAVPIMLVFWGLHRKGVATT